MKSAMSYELSVHHFVYIEKNLAELHLPEIPLTVPTKDENILINCGKLSDPRQVILEVERPGRDFVMRRVDGEPIQVTQADPHRNTYGEELFYDPLDYLTLSRGDKFTWHVNTDAENIRNHEMLREFVGILSNFSLSKQLKLRSNS